MLNSRFYTVENLKIKCQIKKFFQKDSVNRQISEKHTFKRKKNMGIKAEFQPHFLSSRKIKLVE